MDWGILGDVLDKVPDVNTVYDAVTGQWKKAGANLATGGLYGPAVGGVQLVQGAGEGVGSWVKDTAGKIGGAASDAFHSVKDAYNKPFEEKAAGYDAIAARAEQIKQERIARQQATLQQTMAAYEPARKAISAVYGDPSTWKL